MQRILDPAQIEAFAERSIPRLRLADPATLFLKRAERLAALSVGPAIGDYLKLIASLCEAQQRARDKWSTLPNPAGAVLEQLPAQIARAQAHGLPLLQASAWTRDGSWRAVLAELCQALRGHAPAPARAVCERLLGEDPAWLETQADRLLGVSAGTLDLQSAPLLMAALQVYWLGLIRVLERDSSTLTSLHRRPAETAMAGVCPVCGTLPVASVVHADAQYQGYRYLHCPLCATEWHLVRIKCSHCLSSEGIHYHYVAEASEAVRAESCDSCRTYRKILYHEKDPAAEPVADDLASLSLDLLMGEERYRRASGNPFLWQSPTD
jgi:FdhE protein